MSSPSALLKWLETEDDVLVFFGDFDDDDLERTLETVDDNLETEAVEFVRCNDKSVAKEHFGLKMWPALVHFDRGVPVVYNGDFLNDDAILGWITNELKDVEIIHVNDQTVREKLLKRLEFVAVLFYEPVG